MAQTTEIAPNLRKTYKKYVTIPLIKTLFRWGVEKSVNTLAWVKGYSFPKKFTWEWKLEMLLERYEEETLQLFKNIITPGMSIVDIGAHIGYFSKIFSLLTGEKGQVYAFEADPENFALLKKNTRRLQNTRLFNMAVSEKSGTIDFYHIDNSTGCHSIVLPEKPSQKITVNSVSLDDLIAKGEIKSVDIIKIDIEGGEPFAFRGMEQLLKNNPNVKLITEFNQDSLRSGGTTPSDFLHQIRSYGFNIFLITDKGILPIESVAPEDQDSYLLPTGYVNLLCKKS